MYVLTDTVPKVLCLLFFYNIAPPFFKVFEILLTAIYVSLAEISPIWQQCQNTEDNLDKYTDIPTNSNIHSTGCIHYQWCSLACCGNTTFSVTTWCWLSRTGFRPNFGNCWGNKDRERGGGNISKQFPLKPFRPFWNFHYMAIRGIFHVEIYHTWLLPEITNLLCLVTACNCLYYIEYLVTAYNCLYLEYPWLLSTIAYLDTWLLLGITYLQYNTWLLPWIAYLEYLVTALNCLFRMPGYCLELPIYNTVPAYILQFPI